MVNDLKGKSVAGTGEVSHGKEMRCNVHPVPSCAHLPTSFSPQQAGEEAEQTVLNADDFYPAQRLRDPHKMV